MAFEIPPIHITVENTKKPGTKAILIRMEEKDKLAVDRAAKRLNCSTQEFARTVLTAVAEDMERQALEKDAVRKAARAHRRSMAVDSTNEG